MKIATRFRKSLCLGTAAFAAIGLFAAVSEVSASVIDYQALIQGNSALVHHYDLDGASDAVRLADKKGSADLAMAGSALPALGSGGYDATSDSADFDGSNQDLATGAAAVTLDPVSFTSEAIVRIDADGSAGRYIFTAHEGGGDRTLMAVQGFLGSDALAAVGGGAFGPGAEYVAGGGLVSGHWYFLAATFTISGATTDMQAYVADLTTGGPLTATTPVTEPAGNYNTAATSLWLGGPWFGDLFHFDGAIDEAAIFDGALSASTIAAHHAAIIPEPTSALLLALGMVSLCGMRLRK